MGAPPPSHSSQFPRRRFLGLAGGALATGALASCADDSATSQLASRRSVSPATAEGGTYPFRGTHQAGLTAAPPRAALAAGLDVRVSNQAELTDLLAVISGTIEHVMNGNPWEARSGGFPPLDTGLLGSGQTATGTSVVAGFGASLFDDRFGLADRRPPELAPMPKFANDFLVQPERSHGDISLVIAADHQEAVAHAFRQILRVTRGILVPRWSQEGFQHVDPNRGPGEAPGRNLLGFRDGTVNPDISALSEMDDVVWVQPADLAANSALDWTVGGSYQAVRLIRMMVEFWDRTRLNEQEEIFGRDRESGAPLGRVHETDSSDFKDLNSHIGRANPGAAAGEQTLTMLRRGFNYVGGLDENDQVDQGLVFVSYQRSLANGFIAVQQRLDGEALEEYIRPLGGGFFFVPPAPGDGEILGERLLA